MTHKTEGLTNCYSHDLLIIDIVVGAIFVNGRRVSKDWPGPSICSALPTLSMLTICYARSRHDIGGPVPRSISTVCSLSLHKSCLRYLVNAADVVVILLCQMPLLTCISKALSIPRYPLSHLFLKAYNDLHINRFPSLSGPAALIVLDIYQRTFGVFV